MRKCYGVSKSERGHATQARPSQVGTTDIAGGVMSKNGKRVYIDEKKIRREQVEAVKHNELHATIFGVPNVPLREIRDRLDPILRAHAIREITKETSED